MKHQILCGNVPKIIGGPTWRDLFLSILVLAALASTFIFFSVNIEPVKNRNPGVTVVTAYFNLGTFEKGTGSNLLYTPDKYRHWLSVFSLIDNPVICYLERSSPLVEFFRRQRSAFPDDMTQVVEVDRNETWAFKLIPRIAWIYSRPGYPRHTPNTVLPEYSAVMHAKYELMKRSVEENPFRTSYFSWLDVGLFRTIAVDMKSRNEKRFRLDLPKDFDPARSVGYSKVHELKMNASAAAIVSDNLVWICGAYFVGGEEVMLRWSAEYMSGVVRMMNETNYMSTDQQVIYWLFSNKHRLGIRTEIATYSGSNYDPWFYLGYVSRNYNASDRKE